VCAGSSCRIRPITAKGVRQRAGSSQQPCAGRSVTGGRGPHLLPGGWLLAAERVFGAVSHISFLITATFVTVGDQDAM
jgi:hypothetical protein